MRGAYSYLPESIRVFPHVTSFLHVCVQRASPTLARARLPSAWHRCISDASQTKGVLLPAVLDEANLVLAVACAIFDLVHEATDNMDAQATRSPLLRQQPELGLRIGTCVKRLAIIADSDCKAARIHDDL